MPASLPSDMQAQALGAAVRKALAKLPPPPGPESEASAPAPRQSGAYAYRARLYTVQELPLATHVNSSKWRINIPCKARWTGASWRAM